MFQKLLGNLPYNPSLISQVSFYAKRLQQEERLRRTGLILVSLSVIVQLFAVITPPEPTLARSANDIVPGGFSSKSVAVEHCRQNRYDFATILEHFGVSCRRLSDARSQNIRSTDYKRKLLSLGRLPYGKAGERKVVIDNKTYYQRYLWSWDSGPYSTYQALVGTRRNGQPFMILFNCGNPTIVEVPEPKRPEPKPPIPTPPPPPPETDKDLCPRLAGIQTKESDCLPCDEADDSQDTTACLILSKKARNDSQRLNNANGTTAQAGDIIIYSLRVKNTSKVTIKKFVVEENVADILDYATITDYHSGKIDDRYIMKWPPTDIGPGQTITKKLTVKIKDPIPQTPVSASNRGTFDLTMTNVYGDTVNVKLPGSVTKSTEQVVQSLPSTGPGQSLAIATSGAVIVGYFLARSRLLRKELLMVRADFAAGEAS